jgi:citrate lyase subunit beta/citryl-CoA lyase
MIETPGAFFEMAAIARAVPRLAAMNIGGEDFALACGMQPTEETLRMPKQQMIIAARAGGLMPLGFLASVAAYGDELAFAAMVRRSRQFGFMGAGCIHPGQVPVVNREYAPTAEEAAHARRVLEGSAQAEAAGRASFALDGHMIDVPVVERARRLLARLAAIEAKEARKQAAL